MLFSDAHVSLYMPHKYRIDNHDFVTLKQPLTAVTGTGSVSSSISSVSTLLYDRPFVVCSRL